MTARARAARAHPPLRRLPPRLSRHHLLPYVCCESALELLIVVLRGMDRARKVEPRSNKLLYEAELRFRKDCHDRKLRAVKSSVDNGAPKGFGVVR